MRHRAWLYKADILLLLPSGHVQSTPTCHMCPRIAMKASGYICRWQLRVAISKDWTFLEPCLDSQHSRKSLTHSISSSCVALQDSPSCGSGLKDLSPLLHALCSMKRCMLSRKVSPSSEICSLFSPPERLFFFSFLFASYLGAGEFVFCQSHFK